MSKIMLLDEIIANKIAAGEVVENPASVVKELVENSLDAGATEIEVTIEEGGVRLIRVTDNGFGMNADDARLAVKRYATSKIRELEDLESISSYGFRGEALPSIAAVSRLKILTQEPGATAGFEIEIHAGKSVAERNVAMTHGTIIEVQDLFFNTPARRKFLRSENYEKALISDLLTAMALANPEVQFRFCEGDKDIFQFSKCSTWIERIGQVFGRDFEGLLPIEEKRGDFHIQGMISKPAFQRANKSRQYFFVNNRHVRYPKISYSAQEAYQEFILHGRYPYLIIFISANPQVVDVNVHPQKLQVKIHGEKILQEMLYQIIRTTLSSFEAQAVAKQSPFAPSSLAYRAEQMRTPSSIQEPSTISYKSTVDYNLSATQPKPDEAFVIKSEPRLAEELAVASGEYFGIRKILGQISETYLICEDEEGLLLIDQHAAHERVMFEALRRQLKSATPASQALLFPMTLQLAHTEAAILDKILGMLESFGFSIAFLGKGTYSINAYPAVFKGQAIEEILQSVLEQYNQDSQRKMFEDEFDFVAALLACKTRSVKAGQQLSQSEMLSLIKSLASCEIPGHCCHGRPTLLRISKAELEKRFLRKI